MGIPDSYDPLMDLAHANDKGTPAAPPIPTGTSVQHPGGVHEFDGTQNLGTTTTEKMPLETFTTPPDNGLRLPEGAQHFDPLNPPEPTKPPKPASKRFHAGGRGT